mmetsp:Transcript_7551/g.12179  ORF Transcript_7551/g.12179 Transcript_7551/m.12179 type:complete len:424 (+) Transcript_7551:353-1624(+)|eukprot:CAMPEP_0203767776 /NCGR_PEP_ID=MMETSP0099_2-20121227/1195_1 /ASSEMBLY_ACC=CAM_ASM_000209 /TAXON_ID=96639 /ORGANISM=" , Strain NY0313808BC1" /LENGTH=423 /DNA_ID=CAMNT_0050664343 /DNA_START=318 /DNA_END=1589 /DNA_ORIENTATION=+
MARIRHRQGVGGTSKAVHAAARPETIANKPCAPSEDAVKIEEIERACHEKDVYALARLAVTPMGLVNNKMRKRAWPLLVSAQDDKLDYKEQDSREVRTMDAIYNEFQMDIDRSMFHFTCCKNLTKKDRRSLRKDLQQVLGKTLHKLPELYYYQGFHDVASVHLLVCGNVDVATQCTYFTSRRYFRDHHRASFATTIEIMNLLPKIVHHFDSQVSEVIENSGVGSMFALSWVITWFSHSIEDLEVVARLFDAFIACHPMLCLYAAAALLLRPHTKKRLLAVSKQDCSMPTIHHFLQNIPPPCLPGAKLTKKKRKRRSILKKREREVLYEPTASELRENNVDLLVEHALEMMGAFPVSALLCESVTKESSIAIPENAGKPFWCAGVEEIGRKLSLIREKRRKLYPYYLVMATAVGMAAYAYAFVS